MNKQSARMLASLRQKDTVAAIPVSPYKAEEEDGVTVVKMSDGHLEERKEVVMPQETWLDLRRGEFKKHEEILYPQFKEWLRDKDIRFTVTGSEAASSVNRSKYRTAKQLKDEKLGIKPEVSLSEDELIRQGMNFKRGHDAEDYTIEKAEMFLKEAYGPSNVQVWTDKRVFLSREYPFMLVNMDGFAAVKYNDGQWHYWGIEAKNIAKMATRKQAEYQAGRPLIDHILQCRHQIVVMGLDAVLLAATWGTGVEDFSVFIVQRGVLTAIEGDMLEDELVMKEKTFIDYVAGTVTIIPEAMYPEAEANYYGHRYAEKDGEAVIPEDMCEVLEQVLDLDAEIEEAHEAYSKLRRKKDALLNKFHPFFEGKTFGTLVIGDTEYVITCKASRTRPHIDFEEFEAEDPGIYQQVVKEETVKVLDPEKKYLYDQVIKKHLKPGEETGERTWRIRSRDRRG